VAGGGYYYNTKAGATFESGSTLHTDLIRAMKANGDVSPAGDAYNKDGKYYTIDRGDFKLTAFGAAAINALRSADASSINAEIKADA